MISVFVIGLLPDFFAIAITSKSQKIVCGSSPPRTGARHQVPQARPIRDSGNENATQKYRFRPEK